MPSSMCWPLGENSQLKVEGMRSLLKVSASCSRANRPRRLTQAPRLVETVTSGEVVTMRSASARLAAAELVEDRAEAGLRRHHRLARHRQFRRAPRSAAPRWRRVPLGGERHPVEERLELARAASPSPSKRSHSWPARTFIAARNVVHLRRRHQPGVIVLVAGERQAEALDRVGDEADRPVVVDRCRRPRAARQVVAARDWSSAARARRPSARSIRRLTAPWSPMSSRRRLRQAAPPWNTSAE